MPSAAEIIAERLYNVGIRFMLCRHENVGGFMVEGTHHAAGVPGVLVATIGPGVANLVNAVANAWQDRVPMVVLTGCIDARKTASVYGPVYNGLFLDADNRPQYWRRRKACDCLHR